MSKLFSRRLHAACAAVLLSVMPAVPALAQTTQDTSQSISGAPVRVIPADAPMARMEVARPAATDPLQAKLDGKIVGVAPGLRIFSTETLLLSPASLAGQKLNVRYKLDLYGQLLTAWVLTDAEAKAWKAAH